ncbi:MAG TPA: DUF2892 domain-containing protein [Syntrophomonadaceae bacterium]|nr:DUF2892 domain-containing protein [Syntrophomonadaceae bacterium]
MNLDFKRNVGNIDRIIRISIGVILLFIPSVFPISSTWIWIAYFLGAISIIEGFLGY